MPGLAFKSIAGGFLVQGRDNAVVDDMDLKVVTKRQPGEAELRDLKFAFRVAKYVKSNAIVYAKDGATVGIGAGQMSRVDSNPHRGFEGRGGGESRRAVGLSCQGIGGCLRRLLSPSPTACWWRPKRERRPLSSRAVRCATKRSSKPRTTRASPWSSQACGISGTDI